MSYASEVFKGLVDAAGLGVALDAAQDTATAAAGKNGSIGFAFKNAAGNVVLPQLNNEGAIFVTQDAGTCLRAEGKVLSGAQTKDVRSLIGEITISLTKTYNNFSALCACTRTTQFELVAIDDEGVTDTETMLYEGIAGPGQYTIEMKLKKDEFNTIGGTLVQKVKLYGTPLDNVSDIAGAFSLNEVA